MKTVLVAMFGVAGLAAQVVASNENPDDRYQATVRPK